MNKLVVKQIVGTDYDSNCYIIHIQETANAIIIDPNDDEQIVGYCNRHELRCEYIIITHEHYDHVAALATTKIGLGGVIICSKSCKLLLDSVQKQLERTYKLHMHFAKKKIKPTPIYESVDADKTFSDDIFLNWCGYDIQLKETIGHSKGSISACFGKALIFTGDALSYDKTVITKMLGGNREEYLKSALSFYKTLPGDIRVYPGHGKSFLLKEKSLFEY